MSIKMSLKTILLLFFVALAPIGSVFATALIVSSAVNISGTLSYDYIRVLNGGNLTILPGSTITVTSYTYPGVSIDVLPGGQMTSYYSTLQLPNGGGMLLESEYTWPTPGAYNGGKCSLDHSKMTGSYWWGVFVSGGNGGVGSYTSTHFSQAGSPYRHVAELDMTYSTIEASLYGVCNYDYPHDYNADMSGGGLIRANWCTFRNNTKSSLNFSHYQNIAPWSSTVLWGDYSIIQNSVFKSENSAPYTPYGQIGSHIYLHYVEGVAMLGCTFNDDVQIVRNGGVNFANAGGIIDQSCNDVGIHFLGCHNIGASSFNNMAIGVTGMAVAGTHKIIIQRTSFNNMQYYSAITPASPYGIYLVGYNAPSMTNNTMTLQADFSHPIVGIGLEACTNYTLQDNTVNCTNQASNSKTYGLVVNNSGENFNLAYHNTLKNLNYAIQANGNNRSATVAGNGLALLCNDMATNSVNVAYDIDVDEIVSSTYPSIGISQIQGLYSGYTMYTNGNKFASKSTSAIAQNYYNSGYGITLYANSSPETPAYRSASVTVTGGATNNTCPDWVCYDCPVISYPTWATASAASLAVINRVRGEGVNQNTGYSPYDAAVSQYAMLNSNVITSMLCADTFYNYNDSTTCFYDTTVIPLDTIAMILNNTSEQDIYDYKIWLAGLYAQQGLFDNAYGVLNAVLQNDGLDQTQAARINDVYTLISAEQELNDNGDDWTSLSQQTISKINSIAQNSDYYAGSMARYFLSNYDGQIFSPSVVDHSDNGNKSSGNTLATANKNCTVSFAPNPMHDELNITLQNYDGTCMAKVIDAQGKLVLGAFLKGNDKTTLDTRKLAPGNYYIEVINDSKVVHTEKVIKE